jgi:hypothetical protein
VFERVRVAPKSVRAGGRAGIFDTRPITNLDVSEIFESLDTKQCKISCAWVSLGGVRGADAPPSFWDLLNRFPKKVPIGRPLLGIFFFAPLSSKC